MSSKGGFPFSNAGRNHHSSSSIIEFTIPPLRESVSKQSASCYDLSRGFGSIGEESDSSSVDDEESNTRQRYSSVNGLQLHLYEHTECNDETLPESRYGRVWYKILYDAIAEALTVKVIKVMQLPGRESNAPHDSFVKLYLLPDERMSQQTKASSSNIKERTLRLSVYDTDKRKTAKQLLGHALISLADAELLPETDGLKWKDLDDKARPGDTGSTLGDISLSICYLPSMNRLTVVILQVRNLKDIDVVGTAVRITVALTRGHKVMKRREAGIKKGETNLHYNESFAFNVSSNDIESSCISISVSTLQNHRGFVGFLSSLRNFLRMGKLQATHKYGRVVVGSFMFCRGEQLLHWQEMLTQPKKTVTKWHPLGEITSGG